MSIFDKIKNTIILGEDDYDDYDDDIYEDETSSGASFGKRNSDSSDEGRGSRVTPMRSKASRGKGTVSGMEVVVIKPTSVDDAREITDTLLANKIVNLNLEGIEVSVAQRIIDFISGSTYAIDGSIQQISHYIFLIAPRTVDVSGDIPDLTELNGFSSNPVGKTMI